MFVRLDPAQADYLPGGAEHTQLLSTSMINEGAEHFAALAVWLRVSLPAMGLHLMKSFD